MNEERLREIEAALKIAGDPTAVFNRGTVRDLLQEIRRLQSAEKEALKALEEVREALKDLAGK